VLWEAQFSIIDSMFAEVGSFLENKILLGNSNKLTFKFSKGYDGFQSSDTVEMYDPKSDK